MDHLALIACHKVKQQTEYVIKTDCMELCHVLTKNGKNKFQYQLKPTDSLSQLIKRQQQTRTDRSFSFIQLIERSSPVEVKFIYPKEELKLHQNALVRDLVTVNEMVKL